MTPNGLHEVDKIKISQFFKKIPFKHKWVICVQFGSKLQHLIAHYLPYFKVFLRDCSIMGHNRQTIAVLVNLLKKSSFQAKGQSEPYLAQNYSTLYLMICQEVFLKHFSMMGNNRLAKVTLVGFPFSTIVHFGPNSGKNYANIWSRELCHMIHSLIMLKCSMMGCHGQTKVILVNLPKKFPFGARTIEAQCGSKLYKIMAHDSLSEDFFHILWMMSHNRQKKVALVTFPKKISFWVNMGSIWPKITQPCITLTVIEIFRNILA